MFNLSAANLASRIPRLRRAGRPASTAKYAGSAAKRSPATRSYIFSRGYCQPDRRDARHHPQNDRRNSRAFRAGAKSSPSSNWGKSGWRRCSSSWTISRRASPKDATASPSCPRFPSATPNSISRSARIFCSRTPISSRSNSTSPRSANSAASPAKRASFPRFRASAARFRSFGSALSPHLANVLGALTCEGYRCEPQRVHV